MFSPNTDRLVDQLCEEEYQNAVSTWGSTYESVSESSSVLTEEIAEVLQEVNLMLTAQDIAPMMRYARNAIKELAQVVAVCMKINASDPEQ